MISIVHALAYAAPDVLATLPPDLRALLAFAPELCLRPEQRIPRGAWRSHGFLTGRGWGKTHAIAVDFHRRVRDGTITRPALMAPTIDRVGEVQVKALLESSSVLCPCEPYRGGVRWANGVVAEAASAEVERPSSGSNFDFVWMTEIVRWAPSTRRKAFDDITTACRVGAAQYVWDTTSSGKNDVIALLLEQHERAPEQHRVVRGTMFDNPLLTRRYIIDEARKYVRGTRRYDEEVLGLVFSEAAGALWEQDWIDAYRVSAAPLAHTVAVLGLDPAGSGDPSADEVGIAKAYRDGAGHVYVDDLSGRMGPEEYASIVVRECQRDASGVVVERNHFGEHARAVINVHAKLAGMRTELLPDPKRSFPPRRPGTIFVREVVSHTSKETRAAPAAALAKAGLLHHIGTLARLEHEQTTWEPGTRRSPNRLDAMVFAACELGDVTITAPRDAARDVDAAARVNKSLAKVGRPRRLGL